MSHGPQVCTQALTRNNLPVVASGAAMRLRRQQAEVFSRRSYRYFQLPEQTDDAGADYQRLIPMHPAASIVSFSRYSVTTQWSPTAWR